MKKLIGMLFITLWIVSCANTEMPTIGITNPDGESIERDEYEQGVIDEGGEDAREAMHAKSTERRMRDNYQRTTESPRRHNRG